MLGERELSAHLSPVPFVRARKSDLLDRWERALPEAGFDEESSQRVKRALRPALEALLDRLDAPRDGSASGTLDRIGASVPCCSFEEGLRGLSSFRVLLAEAVCADGGHLTLGEVHHVLATADDLATRLASHLHDSEIEHFAAIRARFVAILGHDLRNPLNAITLSATSLQRRNLADAEATFVRHIAKGAHRMARMIADILESATAPLSAEDVALAREHGSLAATCKEALDEMRLMHPTRTLAFDARAEGKGQWDHHRLLRALENLLGNALAYGRRDGPVSVTLEERGTRARISVHNEGEPIDEVTRHALFEPFVRGPAAALAPGLGLGLSIARAIARAHGGEIEAHSSACDGTTFTIDLPLPCAPTRPRALVVDDDRAVAAAMRRFLEARGFDVAVSDSGEDAWDRIRRGQRFALVVSDVDMPGMDGPALLEAARCLWPEIDARFVFVTGRASIDDDRSAGVPCFAKPVGRDFGDHLDRVLAAVR